MWRRAVTCLLFGSLLLCTVGQMGSQNVHWLSQKFQNSTALLVRWTHTMCRCFNNFWYNTTALSLTWSIRMWGTFTTFGKTPLLLFVRSYLRIWWSFTKSGTRLQHHCIALLLTWSLLTWVFHYDWHNTTISVCKMALQNGRRLSPNLAQHLS